jgi:CO dehydrogenase/acetyl-CoA synthase beta subunit
MAVFDVYINKFTNTLEKLKGNGRKVTEFRCPAAAGALLESLPIKVGPEANPGVILRSDTFLELGSPEAGSCAFVLWTNDPSLVNDGRTTVIGPSIQESPGASLPFGQVLIVGGPELGQQDHSALEQSQFISDQIEGYMIRSASGRMWSRVSKEAAGKGFCFDTLGRALMSIFKTQVPKVKSAEVIFVTSSKEDVQLLDDIGSQIREIGKNIVRETWKARGIDLLECTFGGDCNSCQSKSVCDDIRDVLALRKQTLANVEAVS